MTEFWQLFCYLVGQSQQPHHRVGTWIWNSSRSANLRKNLAQYNIWSYHTDNDSRSDGDIWHLDQEQQTPYATTLFAEVPQHASTPYSSSISGCVGAYGNRRFLTQSQSPTAKISPLETNPIKWKGSYLLFQI